MKDKIITLMNNIPSYRYGMPKNSMAKIKKYLADKECDKDYIDNINDDFLKGFGCAKELIFDDIMNILDKK
ncbi:MAG: hypothetical protein UHN47_03790 [Lachnospiraceae bacterium]|nr:hypothetical protein [Lachnospiraceae bacterium]